MPSSWRSWSCAAQAIQARTGSGSGRAQEQAAAARRRRAAARRCAGAARRAARQANQLLGGGKKRVHARLAALHGHPVVVNKWASWCGPCRFEFPAFQALGVKYGKQVAFLGLDASDNDGDAHAFLKKLPVSYPSYSDPDEQSLGRSSSARATRSPSSTTARASWSSCTRAVLERGRARGGHPALRARRRERSRSAARMDGDERAAAIALRRARVLRRAGRADRRRARRARRRGAPPRRASRRAADRHLPARVRRRHRAARAAGGRAGRTRRGDRRALLDRRRRARRASGRLARIVLHAQSTRTSLYARARLRARAAPRFEEAGHRARARWRSAACA